MRIKFKKKKIKFNQFKEKKVVLKIHSTKYTKQAQTQNPFHKVRI